MAYATAAQFIQRYDVRKLGDLIVDNDTRADSTAVAASTVLAAALEDATSKIRAACLAGGAYSVAQLDALSLSGDVYLVRLTCDLALGLLYQRRGRGVPDGHSDVMDEAEASLDALRDGKRILLITDLVASHLPQPVRPSRESSKRIWPVTNSKLYPDSSPSPYES